MENKNFTNNEFNSSVSEYNTPKHKKKSKKNNIKSRDNDVVFTNDCIERMTTKKNKIIVNPYYQEIQFHQDYRDTMNAFNIMCEQKRIFNSQDLPIVSIKAPKENDIKNIVKNFIKELNKVVKKNVYDVAGQKLTNWNDNMPVTNLRNDNKWDKFQKELGLPASIYPEPAQKASVKLIKIDNIEGTETMSEIRYSVHLILQKKNVEDQMIVKINFVINKSDVNFDRDFFEEGKNNFNTNIIIEEISIVGFMITKGFGKIPTSKETLYDFKNIENKDKYTDGRLFNDEEIVKQLNKKKIDIQKNYIKGN
jgi:hypothetical protein